MYESTPNKEEIDWIAERVREIYDYERLKDCDIDYLYNQEFGMRADAQIFEAIFPADESAVQGPTRAFLLDQENADREALTEVEKLRLHMLKKEAEIEIRRAFGHRRELRREHRNKLANSVSDALRSLGLLFPWGYIIRPRIITAFVSDEFTEIRLARYARCILARCYRNKLNSSVRSWGSTLSLTIEARISRNYPTF